MRALIAALALVLAASACRESTFHNRSDFTIHVNEVIVPDSIAPGDALRIEFVGDVGPSSCHSFRDILFLATANQLELELIGTFEVRGGEQCQSVPTRLTPEHAFVHEEAMNDPFQVILYQPDGTTIERQVTVR